MKYNKLKSLLYQREITVADFCEKLQLTRPGLQKSLDNDLLPYNKVEKCCKILGISPNEFFEWETEYATPVPYMAAETIPYNMSRQPSGEVQQLYARIAELKEDKAFLQAQLSALTGANTKKAKSA